MYPAILFLTIGAMSFPSLATPALRFEENHGQAGEEVRFLARSDGYDLLLTRAGAVLTLAPENDGPRHALRLSFPGANPAPLITAVGPPTGLSHYYIGNDPDRWLAIRAY